ncbi:MAG: DUF1592 domain-containing protein [Bryobacterales bacterium]|nr:DUF1592 domain-containing protein [Bryobacterales bacterium]
MTRVREAIGVLFVVPVLWAADPSFTGSVYPVFEKANCRACHAENGVASGSRLHFPAAGADDKELEAFGRRLYSLINPAKPEDSLLVAKPTAKVKHTGGRVVRPESPEETALVTWARHLARIGPDPDATDAPVKAVRLAMRRLTHSQYNNTVRDLLGDQTGPAAQFPGEDFVNGFKNQSEAQSIPALLAEAYGAAAEKLARNAFRGGDPQGLLPCREATGACREAFVRRFGQRAFRRPLTALEEQRYTALAAREQELTAGAQLVIEAMLQSPSFLFRTERGTPESRPWEIASRLSYFLWDTMPDEALFEAAAGGKLTEPGEVERQARRMLRDARARTATEEFVSQWLRFDRVLTAVKDRRQFPMFNTETAWAMTEETRLFLNSLIWSDASFMDAFSARYSFLTPDLAKLYGLPEPAEPFARVEFPAASERAGLLGQATFLSATSKPAETSPTARGLFIREQFLCQHVPDPPPGTNANLPALSEDRPMTTRERLGVHLSNASCAGCHRLIDPIGFGLEKFDAVGGLREKQKVEFLATRIERDKKPVTFELDLDTTGEIAGLPDATFTTAREMGGILAASPRCQECVVKQVFRYGYGRMETAADRPVIQEAFERFKTSGFRFQELLVALAKAHAGGE